MSLTKECVSMSVIKNNDELAALLNLRGQPTQVWDFFVSFEVLHRMETDLILGLIGCWGDFPSWPDTDFIVFSLFSETGVGKGICL